MPRRHLEHLRREATQWGGQNLKQSRLSVNVGFFPWLHHSIITRVLTSQLCAVTVWQYISLFFIVRLLHDCLELALPTQNLPFTHFCFSLVATKMLRENNPLVADFRRTHLTFFIHKGNTSTQLFYLLCTPQMSNPQIPVKHPLGFTVCHRKTQVPRLTSPFHQPEGQEPAQEQHPRKSPINSLRKTFPVRTEIISMLNSYGSMRQTAASEQFSHLS